MKHMKRALSLVLAMVMLLGMMAIPTGAVSNFTDEAEITYNEAVEVTSGLGLFAGSGGKFLPKDTVTRAQMATIIVKMLYGSEANADSFKGVNGGFTDTASFEGGWAEGYINWCASLGVVAGYGDGTFRPGQAVTTAEAVTMILNALKVDAGEGQWPITVMSKADELKFFKDLTPKPDTNKALTREELAVIAFHGLEYSPDGKTSYVYNGVTYDSYMAAYLAAGRVAGDVDVVKKGSLAAEVFGLKSVTGFVTENQATGQEYTEVQAVIEGEVVSYAFNIETDQNAIGHYVTVYYDTQYTNRDPGTTYTIFDEGTVVEVTEDIDSRTEFRAAFDSTSVKPSEAAGCVVDEDYSAVVVDEDFDEQITFVTGDTYDVPAGTYILDGNTVVAYIAPATVYASIIDAVESYEGEDTVSLRGVANPIPNNPDNDMVDEFVAMKSGDYVTYTKVGERYVLERVSVVSGKVTAQSKTEINGDPYDVVTVNGVDYVAFSGVNNTDLTAGTLNYTDTFDFYVTRDNKFIGYKTSSGGINLDSIAYILGVIQTTKKDSYGDQVINFSARGVNMRGVETLIPVAQVKDTNRDGDWDDGEEILGDEAIAKGGSLASNYYTEKNHTDSKARKEGIRELKPFSDTYNKETDPVFVVGYAMTKEQIRNMMTFSGTGTYKFADGSSEYFPIQSSTRCLVVEGTVNQSTPLQARATTGSMSVLLDESHGSDGGANNPKALLSKASGGSYVLEAVVVPVSSVTNSTAVQKIYVSKDKLDYSGNNANGYVYDVYNAADGKPMQITLEEEVDLERGFYKVVQDSETELYEFMPNMGDPSGKIPAPLTTDTEMGNDGGSADGLDGVRSANVLYDAPIDHMSGNMMYAAGIIKYKDASSAVIVDTRLDREVDASRVSRITSLDRIVSLKNSNEDLYIVMDIWLNSSTDKVTAIYITDIQKPEEITDITGVDTVLTKGYTLDQVENLLNAKASKIMGATTTTHDGNLGLFVKSVEENLRKVTLNDGDRITIAADFDTNAGYVDAIVTSTTIPNAPVNWHCMVKFDAASTNVAGDYKVSVNASNGTITLNKLETRDIADLTREDLNEADGNVTFAFDVYAGYQSTEWLENHVDDELLTVEAKATIAGSEVSIEILNAFYTVPKGVTLYSVDQLTAQQACGEFIVLKDGGSLTEGQKYWFTFDGSKIFKTDTTVFCYSYEAGKLLATSAMGVKGLTTSEYLRESGGSYTFGTVSPSATKYNSMMGYHREVTGVTFNEANNTYTMAQDFYHKGNKAEGYSSTRHTVLGNCQNSGNVHTWVNQNVEKTDFVDNPDWLDVKTSLNITNAVIVDARNVAEGSKIDSVAALKAAVDAGAELVVDYLARGQHSATNRTNATTIDCIVIVDTSKIGTN